MITNAMMMLAQAAAPAAKCCGCKCPPHAIAAIAGVALVAWLIGFVMGRRGAAKCKCAKDGAQGAKAQGKKRDARPAEPPRAPIPAGSVEIYVGNLSYDLTEEQLRKDFEAFGTVSSARVVLNSYNGKSKGFGFVVMPNRPEAEAAIAAMSEKEVMGRKMRVNEARNTIKEEA